MSDASALLWQGSLFDADAPAVDASFTGLVHHRLDETSWVDHVPGWLAGSDRVFEWLLANAGWEAVDREMYGRVVAQPRLVTHWSRGPGARPLPSTLEAMRAAVSERYGRDFDSVGANLYRDGRDSVAWHGDRIARVVIDPLVATVSLGHPRRFLLRPRGGRTALALRLGRGDLLVMGGSCQRNWEHSVPKVTESGPRISITLRHSR